VGRGHLLLGGGGGGRGRGLEGGLLRAELGALVLLKVALRLRHLPRSRGCVSPSADSCSLESTA
jgi:hypothetical protein